MAFALSGSRDVTFATLSYAFALSLARLVQYYNLPTYRLAKASTEIALITGH